MKKMLLLSIGDIKNIQREPLLIFSLFGILLLTTVIRFGLPELHTIFLSYTSFPLQPHFRIIVSLALLMAPLMIGMLYGFIILDERDEGVLLFYAVTPITKTGYLFARILAPIIVTFIISFAAVLIQGLIVWDVITFLPVAILLALQSPVVTLLLASLASNKVEGLALTKVINLMLLAPLLDYVISHPIIKITAIFPIYWPVKVFSESDSGNYWWNLLTGFVITLIWLIFLERMFRKRME
ncbi:fluoroquinolone transport system permease protein [Gracilibacillus orientalis]|uniref:Fluoroquinolone transport system permease protein n=1 Tax=Gracilibacillus orientalis TaxID=334253 RepID=A0A1I4KP37_9BACI|nr:hypothetical protein [Gracilibacillus orientalis]SFL80530.1 fluoroquinolone transport system permease protein [Gracilibacillus orientalis]